MNMKIVVIGSGKIGYALAEQLSREEHDITVVDSDEAVLAEVSGELDVACVAGNGAVVETQRQAGTESADLLIAVTSEDEINLLACLIARKLGCKSTIARVRNPEYISQMDLMRDELGLSLVINPERSAANEMFRIMQFPVFRKRDTLARNQVELVEFKLEEGMPFCSKRISELPKSVKARFVICAVERDGNITIPDGNFELKAGDNLSVASFRNDLVQLIRHLGLAKHRAKSIMLLGGSRISYYLAERLARSGADVKIIENDLERCHWLDAALPKCLTVTGDATSQRLLESENIQNMDCVASLLDMDEENVIAALYAARSGVPRTIAKINRTELGFMLGSQTSAVSPKLLAASEVVGYVRDLDNAADSEVVSLHRMLDGRVEALEFRISDSLGCLNTPLMEMHIMHGILVAAIIRNGKAFTPRGDDCFMAGDTVVIVASEAMHISRVNMIIDKEEQR